MGITFRSIVRPPVLNMKPNVKTILTSCSWETDAKGMQEVQKSVPLVKDEQQAERRKKFWELEKDFESRVDMSRLNDKEKLIHAMHAAAVSRGNFTYDDPQTGDRVLTRLRHFLKGNCCGSACRHCIYDHAKVPEVKKKNATFNTAFWVYEENEGKLDLGDCFNKVKPKPRKRNTASMQMISIRIPNPARER